MRSWYPVALLAAAWLAAGCSSTQSYFLDPGYEANKIKASVGILLIERSYFPDVYDHTFGSFRTLESRTFRQFLEPLYGAAAETESWLVPGRAIADPHSFRPHRFSMGADSFEVLVPESRLALDFPTRSPRFLLIFDQYYFRRVTESGGGSNYAGHEPSTSPVLIFETRYVYWDVVEEQVVGYGTARSQVNLAAEEPTVSEYSDVLSQSLTQIARWGPIITP